MRSLIFIYLFVALLNINTLAQPSLRGIRSVFVSVNSIGEDIKNGSLENRIKTDVELKLRMVGIEVRQRNEDRDAILGIDIMGFKIKGGNLIYYVSVSLIEAVNYMRLNNEVYLAESWASDHYLGIGLPNYWEEKIRRKVKDNVDEFLNAYLRDNPK